MEATNGCPDGMGRAKTTAVSRSLELVENQRGVRILGFLFQVGRGWTWRNAESHHGDAEPQTRRQSSRAADASIARVARGSDERNGTSRSRSQGQRKSE